MSGASPGLPAEIAVFPLAGVLLLPNGRLPLNVFEPRYLALVEDSLGRGRLFGMIQPDPGQPAGPTGPALYQTGCLGRIARFAETEDGRFVIVLAGLQRFRWLEELPLRRGYRRLRVSYEAFPADGDPTAAVAARPALLEAFRAYASRKGLTVDWAALDATADAEILPLLAMASPLTPAERQAVLEAPDLPGCAETLLALLRMGAHEAGRPPDARLS